MDTEICKDIVYERQWGRHTNGIIRFTYNSGSYGKMEKIKNGKIIEAKVVDIPGGEHREYALNNGFHRRILPIPKN